MVEDTDHFAAPPAGGVNELQDVGHEDEMEEQVSAFAAWQPKKTSTFSAFELKHTLKTTINYTHDQK